MAYKRHRTERSELLALRREQFLLESKEPVDSELETLALAQRLDFLRAEIRTKLVTYNRVFHPKWGPLFRAGFQESRFALQVSFLILTQGSHPLITVNISTFTETFQSLNRDLLCRHPSASIFLIFHWQTSPFNISSNVIYFSLLSYYTSLSHCMSIFFFFISLR